MFLSTLPPFIVFDTFEMKVEAAKWRRSEEEVCGVYNRIVGFQDTFGWKNDTGIVEFENLIDTLEVGCS